MEDRTRKRLVEIFSSLASETRLGIVEMVSDGKMECQEILDLFDLSQPVISYHLGKLEHAGILVKEKRGSRNCYCLSSGIKKFIELLEKEDQL